MAYDKWQAGTISRDEFDACLDRVRPLVTEKATRMLVYRYKQRFGWTHRKVSAPQGYLAYDHPIMVQWRERYHHALTAKNIHPRCSRYVANPAQHPPIHTSNQSLSESLQLASTQPNKGRCMMGSIGTVRLVLNYDQIWRMVYRGPSGQEFKPRSAAGEEVNPLATRPKRRREAADVAMARSGLPVVQAEPQPKRSRRSSKRYLVTAI